MTVAARPRRRRRGLALALVAVAASACQVRVGTDISVAEDGSGRMAVTIALDEELAGSLTADDFDPFAGLQDLPDGWSFERSDADGGMTATVSTDFEDPAGLAARVSQLGDGVDDEDPLLFDDVELAVAEDGSATFRGRAGFRPPSSTGLEGVGVAFDGDDLQAVLAERGDEVMRVDLRVSMPGPVVDSDADAVDGRTATWNLPVTELVEVRAASDPPADRTWWVVGGAVLLGLVLGSLLVGVFRRRG